MDDSNQDNWKELLQELGDSSAKPLPAPDRSEVSGATSEEQVPAEAVTEGLKEEPYEEPTRPDSGWGDLLGQLGIPDQSPDEAAPVPETGADGPAELGAPEDQARAAKQAVFEEGVLLPSEPPKPEATEETEPEFLSESEPFAHGIEESEKDAETSATLDQDPLEEEASSLETNETAPDPVEKPTKATFPWEQAANKKSLALPEWFPFTGRRSQEIAPDVDSSITPTEMPSSTESSSEEEQSEEDQAKLDPETTDEAAKDSSEATEAEKRPRGGRRRRGRRGRRGGGRNGATETDAESGEGLAKTEVSSDKDNFSATPAPEESEDSHDETASDEPDSEESKSPGRSATHRSVPSWSDAICVIVDANIEARSERKKVTRGSGGGRGRRGGGRRKKRSDS